MTLPRLTGEEPALRATRAVAALLGLGAVAYQFALLLDRPDPRILNFFSFFTIQSSLFGCAILLLGAFLPARTPLRDGLRGAAALFLTITAIVYLLLLTDADAHLGLTAPAVNVILHQVLPLAVVADWILAPPQRRVSRGTALTWLLYPAIYFASSMLRGYAITWYPYPFLNPGLNRGYSGVFALAAGLAVLIALLALLIARLGNQRVPTSAAGP